MPTIPAEQLAEIHEAAHRIAAAAPDHFTTDQLDVLRRTWVPALNKLAARTANVGEMWVEVD